MEVFYLEEELIHKIEMGDEKSVLSTFKKLYDYYISLDLGNGSKLRSIKNHLILLNQSLYINFYDKGICRCSLYKMKNNIVSEIEKTDSEDELFELGQRIIIRYFNVTGRKCVYVEKPIVCMAINYINNHIDENINLEKVSKAINVSKSYLSSIFMESTGYSFTNYINKIKIENSKSKLKDTSKSILDIAIECGFNSQSYFCSTFKKFTGMTPKEYRKKQLMIKKDEL